MTNEPCTRPPLRNAAQGPLENTLLIAMRVLSGMSQGPSGETAVWVQQGPPRRGQLWVFAIIQHCAAKAAFW